MYIQIGAISYTKIESPDDLAFLQSYEYDERANSLAIFIGPDDDWSQVTEIYPDEIIDLLDEQQVKQALADGDIIAVDDTEHPAEFIEFCKQLGATSKKSWGMLVFRLE
jgi:hypothetical protein